MAPLSTAYIKEIPRVSYFLLYNDKTLNPHTVFLAAFAISQDVTDTALIPGYRGSPVTFNQFLQRRFYRPQKAASTCVVGAWPTRSTVTVNWSRVTNSWSWSCPSIWDQWLSLQCDKGAWRQVKGTVFNRDGSRRDKHKNANGTTYCSWTIYGRLFLYCASRKFSARRTFVTIYDSIEWANNEYNYNIT